MTALLVGDAYRVTEVPYGFTWGPLTVERCISDPKWGVMVLLKTEQWELGVRVTPTGRIRVGLPTRRAK